LYRRRAGGAYEVDQRAIRDRSAWGGGCERSASDKESKEENKSALAKSAKNAKKTKNGIEGTGA
jgi:hypothetical protein